MTDHVAGDSHSAKAARAFAVLFDFPPVSVQHSTADGHLEVWLKYAQGEREAYVVAYHDGSLSASLPSSSIGVARHDTPSRCRLIDLLRLARLIREHFVCSPSSSPSPLN